ncbi:MAG TPA: hypothetical protein VI111_00270 [Thermoleophilaceae bacterium]
MTGVSEQLEREAAAERVAPDGVGADTPDAPSAAVALPEPAEPPRGEALAAAAEALLRPVDSASAPDAAAPLSGAADPPHYPAPARSDVVAALIGAEAGAAIGLLWFGWTPLMPIAVTLGIAAAGPVVVRASRPLRLLLFRHWLRSQLSGPSS